MFFSHQNSHALVGRALLLCGLMAGFAAMFLFTDYLGVTSPEETEAGICFPRTSVAWDGRGENSGFYCPTPGYELRFHEYKTDGDDNTFWFECVNSSCNNPQPRPQVWTEYCTGANDINGNNWQWWESDDSNPPQYRFKRAGDGTCVKPPAPAPTGLTHTCRADGAAVNFSWNAVPGYPKYYPRISNAQNSAWCISNSGSGFAWGGDTCRHDNWSATSLDFAITPGSTFNLWVHAGDPMGPLTVRNNNYCPMQPIGYLDSATCGTEPNTGKLRGWTCDPDNYAAQLDVHIYRDGQPGVGGVWVGSVKADRSREAAVGVRCGGGTSAHGFEFTLPEDLRDGQSHNYYVYGINEGTGGNTTNTLLSGSPKATTCTIPPPINAVGVCERGDFSPNSFQGRTDWIRGKLTWTRPAGYTTFMTRVGDAGLPGTPGFNVAIDQVDDLVGNERIFPNLPNYLLPGNTYYWWVHTRNIADAVAPYWSVERGSQFTCPLIPPPTPTSLSVSCVGTNDPTQNTGTFAFDTESYPASPTYHELTLTDPATGVAEPVITIPAPATYNFNYTQNFTTNTLRWANYNWSVRACNGAGCSVPSTRRIFRCVPPPPTITVGAVPTLVRSGDQPKLWWDINAVYPLSCTLRGGATDEVITHTPPQTLRPRNNPLAVSPITNSTTYTISCAPAIATLPPIPPQLPPLLPVNSTVRVEVVPKLEEI